MRALDLIAKELAKPATHVVVTRYADGSDHRFAARSAAAAENYATGERRRIGMALLNRQTGVSRTAVAVAIEEA